MGRRIRKTTWNGTATGTWQPQLDLRFLHEIGGWNILAEITADSKFLRTYTWGPDLSGNRSGAGGVGGLLLTNLRASGKTFANGMDLNGNVALLVNTATGKAAATYDYGPFGEPIRQSGEYAKTNPYRFSTKYTDDETGLLDYGHRYYDPMTGRWLSRDPVEEEGGINLYGFVSNNGVTAVDFLGLKEQLLTVISGPNGSEFGTSDTRFGNPPKTYGEILGIGSGITLADGVGPLGPTTQQLQQGFFDRFLEEWENRNNKKCCHSFKANSIQSSRYDPMTADRAKNLILEWQKKSDQLVLLAHGVKSKIPGGETGLLFYKGQANNMSVSMGFPVASIVSNEIKELRILACFDAGIPSGSNGTKIIKVGRNVDQVNYGASLTNSFKDYIHKQCDACH